MLVMVGSIEQLYSPCSYCVQAKTTVAIEPSETIDTSVTNGSGKFRPYPWDAMPARFAAANLQEHMQDLVLNCEAQTTRSFCRVSMIHLFYECCSSSCSVKSEPRL